MKIEQKRSIDTSQFSPEDWKRLTEYVSLLMTIERKMHKKTSTTQESK
jgi:hypothetical protein